MYPVNFEPFVGNDYSTQSPKILILGESHYGGEGEQLGKGFTDYVVRRFAKRENGETRRFFTRIAKLVDPRLDNQTAKELWDRVAFYNYVQVLVGDGPRQRPTGQMFTDSNDAFEQVINQLNPDIVIVLGKRLGSHLAYNQEAFSAFLSDVILCQWTHPSTPHGRVPSSDQSHQHSRVRETTKPCPSNSSAD